MATDQDVDLPTIPELERVLLWLDYWALCGLERVPPGMPSGMDIVLRRAVRACLRGHKLTKSNALAHYDAKRRDDERLHAVVKYAGQYPSKAKRGEPRFSELRRRGEQLMPLAKAVVRVARERNISPDAIWKSCARAVRRLHDHP